MWDLGFADNYPDALEHEFDLYENSPPDDESFLNWRDTRLLDEIHWFGWFIDYWMEVRNHVEIQICLFQTAI